MALNKINVIFIIIHNLCVHWCWVLQDPRHAEDQQPVHAVGADEGDDSSAEEGQRLGDEEGGEAGGGDVRRNEETPGECW